jgi:peptidoglycan/xylan/chitin deacetylase (PgdA/CDA1 family)
VIAYKPKILSLLDSIRFFHLLRYLKRDRVGILMYHRFSKTNEPFKLSQKVFESQVKFLKNNYNLISLKQYSDFLNGVSDSIPKNSMILTFDDGYKDNYEAAYPVLKKYSAPATIFLATDFVDKNAWLWANKLEHILKNSKISKFDISLRGNNFHFKLDTFEDWHQTQLKIYHFNRINPEKQKNEFLDNLAKLLKVKVPQETTSYFASLSWDQIREMNKNGIDFGSHTQSHCILSRIDKSDINNEVVKSKEIIESKIDKPVVSFCYPNGQLEDINNDIVSLLKKSGYGCAVTTVAGFNTKNIKPYFLKRMWLSFLERPEVYMSKELTLPNRPSKTHLIKNYIKS